MPPHGKNKQNRFLEVKKRNNLGNHLCNTVCKNSSKVKIAIFSSQDSTNVIAITLDVHCKSLFPFPYQNVS